MTNAEHHQAELEQQEQAYDTMCDLIRTSVVSAKWDAPIAGVTGLRNHSFSVIDFDGNCYKVTIEED